MTKNERIFKMQITYNSFIFIYFLIFNVKQTFSSKFHVYFSLYFEISFRQFEQIRLSEQKST